MKFNKVPIFYISQDSKDKKEETLKNKGEQSSANEKIKNLVKLLKQKIKNLMIKKIKIDDKSFKSKFAGVRLSKFFVDKTNFIAEVSKLDTNYVHYIFGPRRWGKSTNLFMLSDFLNIEQIIPSRNIDITENNKRVLFEGTEIFSNDELVKKYFGQYPVIFFDFSEAKTKTEQDLNEYLNEKMTKVYERFTHLEDHPKYGKKFLKLEHYLDEKKYLAFFDQFRDLLELIYNSQVAILIDEADQPVTYALEKANEKNDYNAVKDTYLAFLKTLFKTSESRGIYVMTGINRLSGAGLYNGLNIKDYKLLDGKFVPYYSFTKEEVDDLIKRADVGEFKEKLTNKITEYYNGYHIKNIQIYNCFSVISALTNLESVKQSHSSNSFNLNDENMKEIFQIYWAKSGSFNPVKKLLVKWQLAILFQKIFDEEYSDYDLDKLKLEQDKEDMMIRYFSMFTKDDMKDIDDVQIVDNTLLLAHLVSTGYLTPVKNSDIIDKYKDIKDEAILKKIKLLNRNQYTIKYPNLELKIFLESQRDSLYLDLYNMYFKEKSTASDSMLKLIKGKDVKDNIMSLIHAIKQMAQSNLTYLAKMSLDSPLSKIIPNERTFHSMIYSFLPTNFDNCFTLDDVYIESKNRPDIYYYEYSSKLVTIIEIKRNHPMETAFMQSFEYNEGVLLEHPEQKFKKVINIGLSIDTSVNFKLCCKYSIMEVLDVEETLTNVKEIKKMTKEELKILMPKIIKDAVVTISERKYKVLDTGCCETDLKF